MTTEGRRELALVTAVVLVLAALGPVGVSGIVLASFLAPPSLDELPEPGLRAVASSVGSTTCTVRRSPCSASSIGGSRPGFTAGPAQACAVAEIGTPGSRTVNRTDEVCAEVILS